MDGDSLTGVFQGCQSHREQYILVAYQELPPAWDGINLDQSSVSISQGTSTGTNLEGKVSLTTTMSVGVEMEEDLKIIEVGASAKYNISTAMEHFDGVQRATTRSKTFTWPGLDEDGNLFRDDAVYVFDQTQNVYEYKVLNPRLQDPAFFTIIGAAVPVPGQISREAYETSKTNLNLIGNRVFGRVTSYPTNSPGQTICTGSLTGVRLGTATDSLSFEKTEETGDSISLGFGFESEFSVGQAA